MGDRWFEENEIGGSRFSLKIDKVIFEGDSDLQKTIIFENQTYGRVLVLDGMIQATEGDEFIYHEMLTDVPLLAHGNVKEVLIIGGGEGQMLRRALQHPGVNRATMVEIDDAVIQLSKKHLPFKGGSVFDHPKARIVIADGCKFVKETKDKFDIIIVDSCDPIGPAEVLFTEEFYRDCHNCLTPGGIMVTQSGSPMIQPDELCNNYRNMAASYADVTFYTASIPTYPTGLMAFGWATDNKSLRQLDQKTIAQRLEASKLSCRYYTPEIHFAAFALPQYIKNMIAEAMAKPGAKKTAAA